MKPKLNLSHLGIVTILSVALGLALKWKYHTEWSEFLGLVTGLVGIYLAAIEHIINWPIGIANVLILAYVFYQSKLYADLTLQFFYLALNFQGWWQWAKGGTGRSELRVSRMKPTSWPLVIGLWALGTAVYAPIITHFRGNSPLADSTLTVASVITQFMLNFKKLENWILWVVIDACYIYLYITRHLESTAVLYAFFLFLAPYGFWQWVREPEILQANNPAEEFSQRL